MPNRARRTKGWCKPMATVTLPNPKEEITKPVKNLCERLGLQRRPQLHSRSQEQILHLILAKRPRRYDAYLFLTLLVLARGGHVCGSLLFQALIQFIFKREKLVAAQLFSYTRLHPKISLSLLLVVVVVLLQIFRLLCLTFLLRLLHDAMAPSRSNFCDYDRSLVAKKNLKDQNKSSCQILSESCIVCQ